MALGLIKELDLLTAKPWWWLLLKLLISCSLS